MSLYEERAARNEALFREVNERVRSLAESTNGDTGFLCECSDTECFERIQVPIAVYEAVRAHGRRFIVSIGHERGFESVVEQTAAYSIVEKEGAAGRVAERTDPRS